MIDTVDQRSAVFQSDEPSDPIAPALHHKRLMMRTNRTANRLEFASARPKDPSSPRRVFDRTGNSEADFSEVLDQAEVTSAVSRATIIIIMKALLLASLVGAATAAPSVTLYHMFHETGGNGRYEMQVLPDSNGTVVTLDRESGTVRYIYGPGSNVPFAQWAVEFKPGASIGQVPPPEHR
jgi:hypothetical protein